MDGAIGHAQAGKYQATHAHPCPVILARGCVRRSDVKALNRRGSSAPAQCRTVESGLADGRMPGGPEPQVRPNRAPGAEGAAGEEEVVTGGSSRRRKAECPRRRRSRREMPGEEEELGLGGRPR